MIAWWEEHDVLRSIAEAIDGATLQPDRPHGMKLYFGGSGIAEVRLDGEVHEAASDHLFNLAWPRSEPPAFLRTFVVLMHREDRHARPGVASWFKKLFTR